MILETPDFKTFKEALDKKSDVRGVAFWSASQNLVSFKVILTAKTKDHIIYLEESLGSAEDNKQEELKVLAKVTDKRLLSIKKELEKSKIMIKSGRWLP